MSLVFLPFSEDNLGWKSMSEEQQFDSASEQFPSSETTEKVLSQEQLLALLHTTIEQLDGIVKKLETESLVRLPATKTVITLVESTQAIATVLEPTSIPEVTPPTPEAATETPIPPEETTTQWDDALEPEPPEPVTGIDRAFPSFAGLQSWWDGILRVIRSIMPSALVNKLSDWAITGILAGILVILLTTSVLLLPRPLNQVAKSPAEPPQPKVVATPPLLESPETPQPVKVLPPPEPEFTPEQNLIGAIQQEVIDLTSQYPEGLIGSIEANFSASRLIVTVGKQWYQLTPRRQNTLANSISERAQRLDFRKLEMIDSQGELVARSPVVGNEIIIMRRQDLGSK